MPIPEIASSAETGKLNVMHLKRYWNKSMLIKSGRLSSAQFDNEWTIDGILLDVLGLGLEQTIRHVYQTDPNFEQFENWIIDVTGGPDAEKIGRFNQLFTNDTAANNNQQHIEQVLSPADMEFWNQNGYIIIKNAVSKQQCDETIEALCNHIGINRFDPETWYNHHPARQGIMVQLFQHPVLDKNRQAPAIRKAYEQLWNHTALWPSTDRVGFNPPETARHPFQGPRLHWDVSLDLPIPFGLQGLLYLADTAENQGAFTLVPGFQNRVDEWINSLPPGTDPRFEDLYALGTKPIAANAGDFIIWHHALPHGSSPNTATLPRFVHYINYKPAFAQQSSTWV